MQHKITTRQYAVPFLLITSLFFLWGFARAILDVLNKHFQQTLNVDITQSAWIQVVTYLGYFLMSIPAGMFISRFGYRRGVVFGLVLFAAGAFLFVPSAEVGTLNAYLFCLFVIACGLAFLETSANPYSALLGPVETSTSRLNLSQSFNGMGSFLAPLLVGGFLFAENAEGQSADVSLPYLIMGIVVLVIAVIFSLVQLPEVKTDSSTIEAQSPASLERDAQPRSLLESLGALYRNRLFVLGLSALLCYEIGEISINSYFVNFCTDMGSIDAATASYILSLALVVFMVGRFIGSWLMLYMRAEQLLLLCASGSLLCMSMVLLSGSLYLQGTTILNDAPMCGNQSLWGTVSFVFLIANYLFESIMFPTIFSLALQGLGRETKMGSSLLMMTPVGGCGFLLVAWMADHTTPVTPFVVPLLAFLVVWIYAWRKAINH